MYTTSKKYKAFCILLLAITVCVTNPKYHITYSFQITILKCTVLVYFPFFFFPLLVFLATDVLWCLVQHTNFPHYLRSFHITYATKTTLHVKRSDRNAYTHHRSYCPIIFGDPVGGCHTIYRTTYTHTQRMMERDK